MVKRIQLIEDYAKSLMTGEAAHDFQHADRVRRWALKIAVQEQYPELDRVEAAALLHDIGLASGGRKRHAEVGADLAEAFLREYQLFSEEEIAEIASAIRSHNSLEDSGMLAAILRDADILDLLGPVGIMRAFTSKANLEEYSPHRIKGETWGLRASDFTERFRSGVGIGTTVVDQINFQISCFDNLNTQAAKRFAPPLAAFMRTFMDAFEAQISLD